jgi:hypothetical protein
MNRFICYVVLLLGIGFLPLCGIELGETLKVDKHLIPVTSGFIHYRIKDQKLQLIFLNKKKAVISPAAKDGLVKVRFINARTKADVPYTMPLVLTGSYLEGVRSFRLPLNYRILITLKMADGAETVDLPLIELRPDDLSL